MFGCGRLLACVALLGALGPANGGLQGQSSAGPTPGRPERAGSSQPARPAPASAAPDLVAVCCGDMRYRMIGPHRGGRTTAAAGIPDQPHVFYVGVVNGGVWKTTDAGRTWRPILDDEAAASIGAIAVAPSDPNVIYVGTGDGLIKSTDAGQTWTRLGLRDGRQIPQIVVHPREANRLWVAVLGHPYGANEERGIFRSTDGGRTLERVLHQGPDVGAADVVLDPQNPDVVYAVLREAQRAPWGDVDFRGAGTGIFKSNNGGTTWRAINNGLPTFEQDGLGRIALTVAPSNSRRLFATVDAQRKSGLYRSDDAGESWQLVNDDPRITMRESGVADVEVHPANPDIVLTGAVVAWKSTDGGKTFNALRGAPGGDEYHRIWINVRNPEIMLFATARGAVVTLNGGASWSSSYNQPTAQFHHVSTDHDFPYRVCGGQEQSGSACVASRGDHGRITFREWRPVGADEHGDVAPDPTNTDIYYGGKVTRHDWRTGQTQNVAPLPVARGDYRVARTMPLLFSPADRRTLFFGSNVLWKTLDGGLNWTGISPDLSRETWDVPPSVGRYRASPDARPVRRGAISAIAPSPLDINVIWAGTDDGLIHVTRDGGKTWSNVTPPSLVPWATVSSMEASHFAVNIAYAAVDMSRLDDVRPRLYRTRDGGQTWIDITRGLPDGGVVHAVREDIRRRGLLFAGTERAVYISFDDGDDWQSLRLNMPATSIRDLVIKDDDLVVGTDGRSLWILDDITPLRQVGTRVAASDVHLYRPQDAWRVRWNMNTDAPLPPDEPAGENPPDGAVINYWLKAAVASVVIEIRDAGGRVVRRHTSEEKSEPARDEGNVPRYWIRQPRPPARTAGMHRVVWDLRFTPPKSDAVAFPIAATPGNTPRVPAGPWVMPGGYTVRLTAGGQTLTQPLLVRMDPRVKAVSSGLDQQFKLSMRLYAAMNRTYDLMRSTTGGAASAPTTSGSHTEALERARDLHHQLTDIYNVIQGADVMPSPHAVRQAEELLQEAEALGDI
jgi:photosystem II stability/assembly factor-like uncharacterized protein